MKFILWVIIILLVIRMVRKSVFISVNRSFNEQMKNNNPTPKKPEGTVTIENTKQNLKGKKNDDGDYVDYEEVK